MHINIVSEHDGPVSIAPHFPISEIFELPVVIQLEEERSAFGFLRSDVFFLGVPGGIGVAAESFI